MINKKLLFLYITLASLILFYELFDLPQNKESKIVNEFSNINIEDLKLWSKKYDAKNVKNEHWGLPKEKVLKKVKKVKKDIKKVEIISVKINNKNNQICIGKSCYRLLGIYKKSGVLSASFFNVTKKLSEYKKDATLESGIFISDISKSNIIFKEKKSTRAWTLSIFNVNSKKYKPKVNK